MPADASGGQGAATGADRAGVQAAIDRYRDLAKYLITIFAGVGALLAAGTQLASIGTLTPQDETGRFIAVVLGLILAIGAIAAIIGLALRVLKPIEVTFEEAADDPGLREQINKRTSLLGGADDIDQVRANVRSNALAEEDLETWYVIADGIVAEAAYLRTRETFEGIWWPLLWAAVAGVVGITTFAWGANPPDDTKSATPIVQPAPVPLRITLTADGREALAGALGGDGCTTGPLSALSIGGTENAPRVVTLPHGSCKAVQFMLSAAWGAATSENSAPGR